MHSSSRALLLVIAVFANIYLSPLASSLEQDQAPAFEIEEIIITAQKREQNLQDIPIAISVLTEKQLLQQGVSSLGDLVGGTISSLNINPYGAATSTLSLAIRGNGPGDVASPSRDTNVAVYLDEIYLGRAQGLDFELAELKRIEVLRGPQGTLYGRNATAGAVNLISKRPSGEFGIRQRFGVGSDDLRSSNTHIDLPQWAGISSKIDYLHTERDGWVNNTAPGESDYNAFDKQGLRISIDMAASDDLTIGYTYNETDTETTQLYYQFYRDFGDSFGDEGARQSQTRFPIAPLEPTRVEQQVHSINLDWNLSDTLRFVSLSSYRELDDKTRNNWAGAIYFNGVIEQIDVEQEQFSQEFRLQGSQHRLEWVTGIYHYEEKTNEELQQLFSLDIFGIIDGIPLSPITPPNNFDLFTGEFVPLSIVDTELESTAIYGQATWTPPILNDQLEVTVGVRHSRENKSGNRVSGGRIPFTVPFDHQTDPAVTLNYRWADNLSTYIKWSSAYRSGGVNSRAPQLTPFREEEVETVEAGMKIKTWDNRLSLNTALFKTDYDHMFIDIIDPNDFTIGDTINAANTVTVEGAEIDLAIAPIRGLIIGLSYTYLDGDIPPQPNPLNANALEDFLLTQTPEHSGALTLDYELPRFSFGTLTGHINIVSSSDYNHWPSGGPGHLDGYYLINARIELKDISLYGDYGRLSFSLWGKNIADEEYVISSFNFEGGGIIHAFGDPRTIGIEMKYEY